MSDVKFRKVYDGDKQTVTPRGPDSKWDHGEVPVEQQMDKEELAKLQANIHFTHQFLKEESDAKINSGLPD